MAMRKEHLFTLGIEEKNPGKTTVFPGLSFLLYWEENYKLGLISFHLAISGTMFKVTNSSRILQR